MPLNSELDGVIDLDPNSATCPDCLTLDFIKDSGPLAVDLAYSSVRGRLTKIVDFLMYFENFAAHFECYYAGL